jgi:hypothetical protein
MRDLTMLVMVVAMVSAMFATPVLAKVIGGTNEDDELVGTPKAVVNEIGPLLRCLCF